MGRNRNLNRMWMLMIAAAASLPANAQNVTANGALSSANSIVSGMKDLSFHLASGIIAIVAIFLLVWQGAKYLKGDPQFKDSLMAFGAGLLIIAVMMEVIKAVF